MLRVGVDVQPVGEVESSIREFGTRYTDRLFSDRELTWPYDSVHRSAEGLAARFAAKEAVLKLLDPLDVLPGWRDIEIVTTPSGRPEVVLTGDAAMLADRCGLGPIALSFSHAGGVATAVAAAEDMVR